MFVVQIFALKQSPKRTIRFEKRFQEGSAETLFMQNIKIQDLQAYQAPVTTIA